MAGNDCICLSKRGVLKIEKKQTAMRSVTDGWGLSRKSTTGDFHDRGADGLLRSELPVHTLIRGTLF
jgi:hypothetical protein